MVRRRKTTYKTTHKKSYRKRKHQGLSEAEKRERNDRYADIISRFNTGEYGEDYEGYGEGTGEYWEDAPAGEGQN